MKEVNMKYKWKTKVAAPLSLNYKNKYPPVIQNINELKIYWSAVFSENTTQQAIFQKKKIRKTRNYFISPFETKPRQSCAPKKTYSPSGVRRNAIRMKQQSKYCPKRCTQQHAKYKIDLKEKIKSKCESVKLT